MQTNRQPPRAKQLVPGKFEEARSLRQRADGCGDFASTQAETWQEGLFQPRWLHFLSAQKLWKDLPRGERRQQKWLRVRH